MNELRKAAQEIFNFIAEEPNEPPNTDELADALASLGLTVAQPLTREREREYGWCIEERLTSGTLYFTGRGQRAMAWSSCSEDAMRFSRKQDAEVLAKLLCMTPSDGVYIIAEHVWVLSRPDQPTEPAAREAKEGK